MTVPDAHAASKNAAAAASAPPAGAANVRATAVAAPIDAAAWQQHDQRVYQCIKIWIEQWWEPQQCVLIDAMGEVLSTERRASREAIIKLTERVVRLEAASDFRLASEVKQGSEVPQSELLARIESLQRQVDELKRLADLDAGFLELAERVGELEKTNSLEARFTKLANEAKGGSESELQARIDGLERQLDDLKKIANQPGPQGPPGPPGKLPSVRDYVAGHVHYEADVVTHAGALWQACCDTVHAPPHSDWLCLARAGRDGLTPTIRGTYDVNEGYKMLDVVALDGASFIAKHDDPGICPGNGWQLLSRQGKPGRRGETGDRGPKGDKGPAAVVPRFVNSEIDENYNVIILRSDGSREIIPMRAAFERFLSEVGG